MHRRRSSNKNRLFLIKASKLGNVRNHVEKKSLEK